MASPLAAKPPIRLAAAQRSTFPLNALRASGGRAILKIALPTSAESAEGEGGALRSSMTAVSAEARRAKAEWGAAAPVELGCNEGTPSL
jgi:hypothetical protein